jgi:hypothetical protein
MNETKLTAEDKFREGLKDLLLFVQKLGPMFDTIEDMTSIVSLAVENDAQLRLLMKLASARR